MYEAILNEETCRTIKNLELLQNKECFLFSDQHNYEIKSDVTQQGSGLYKPIKLICVSVLIYLMAGSWIGWDVPSFQEIFFMMTCISLFIWWFFKSYVVKIVSSKKSKKLQICIYCLIPWRILSRFWGKLAAVYVPIELRIYAYGIYCKLFSVNIEEIEYPLNHYSTLVAFFTRKLKDGSRLINSSGCLVVPCDGTLVCNGPVYGKQIRQVKGLDYHMNTFLGYQPMLMSKSSETTSRLFQCVLYLAPGDYHRFHSPCDWTIFERMHFHGRLLSVSPLMTKWFPDLLAINERVVYTGEWKHGFFSYTAVGATNVGSITVHGDPTLTTNKRKRRNKDHIKFHPPNELNRGEEIGFFSMGSSVVLIFEAPENFQFNFFNHTCVKLGDQLGLHSDPDKLDCLLCSKIIINELQ